MCCIDVPLAYMPEPIAENAAQFAEGARITVYLTLVSGLAGLVLGVLGRWGGCRAFRRCGGWPRSISG